MNQQWPEPAYAAALAALPEMTLGRLSALIRHHSPSSAFRIAAGQQAPLPVRAATQSAAVQRVRHSWKQHATDDFVDRCWQRVQALGLRVLVYGAPHYPTALLADKQAPPVLFAKGDLSLLNGRRAALVGTRNATSSGRSIAFRFGAELSANGVHIVSGLARGIDGCAHRGVMSQLGFNADGAHALRQPQSGTDVPFGRPIAVVGSGHDVVYPREHASLWSMVAEHGLLLTEAPPGTPPIGYRFPLRNRLIAALSEVVVVVESRERGGSLITATEAGERGIPVMAVPGSAASRAAIGTTALLREGASIAGEPLDVLTLLDLEHRHLWNPAPDHRIRPRGGDLVVFQACLKQPQTIESIMLGCSLSLVSSAMSLARLEQAGWLTQYDGWFESLGNAQ